MERSTERVRTTHCGSLARPVDLLRLMKARYSGEAIEHEAYEAAVQQAVVKAVGRQHQAGLDAVSDGEQGKIGHATYIADRLSGFEARAEEGDSLFSAEEGDFPEYYERYFSVAMLGGAVIPKKQLVCVGPIAYRGGEALDRELGNFSRALGAAPGSEAFVSAIAPSGVGMNEFYATEQDYLFAAADALHEEYRKVIEAGFVLQIDDPFLTETYSYASLPLNERRERAELYVEAVNLAIKNLPGDRIRFHTCYGINEGPRIHDVPLEEIIELVLRINAGAYSFESANPRHEHEYHLWERVKLPEGKIILPGVVTHSTNVVEHPELIAERIVRFAERVGRENVIAGADCGFSSQATFAPEIDPGVVWAKFEAMVAGARLASNVLWK